MTVEEFRDAVNKLMIEFNKSQSFDITVFVHNFKTGEGFNFGYGCPACAAKMIALEYSEGVYGHNDHKEIKH